MNNLLPTIKPTITHRADDKILSWRPDDAHPKTGKVSLFLESVFTKETTIKIIYGQNVLPSLPPNEKHIENSIIPSDESPLKAALSEVADRPRLVFVPPPSLTRKTIIKDMSNGNCLMMKMINTLPICMDLFVQKKLAISTTTVCPMRQCIRCVTQHHVIPSELQSHIYPITLSLILAPSRVSPAPDLLPAQKMRNRRKTRPVFGSAAPRGPS
jgi:hypothetical protein